ncbi:protein brain tumor [Onthophagus taurus]|uniref:protein brain tumor n=1 Tax=Onthophagus taurus TaxID=166361 RepID=UPI000C1FDE78|nr:brain tumor protein-like [Onthophagus taurus]XP_022902893.1 brain tumor protein-like [Onthophagus taurus]XP_022902894.1 brain tumor protein-like [Onthophagus taurus]
MASPTSIDSTSISRANSLGSFSENPDEFLSYVSSNNSPLTVSNSSPSIAVDCATENNLEDGLTAVVVCLQCHEPSSSSGKNLTTHEKNKFICSKCQLFTENLENILNNQENTTTTSAVRSCCTACKTIKFEAIARCLDCCNFLCPNCVMAHNFMHCFEGHRVINFNDHKEDSTTKSQQQSLSIQSSNSSSACVKHKTEPLKYYCKTCMVPVCKECITIEHSLHELENFSAETFSKQQFEAINLLLQEAKLKANDIKNVIKNVEHISNKLQIQYHKAQNEISETFQFYRSMLDERKNELLKELESVYSAKQIALGVTSQKGQELIDSIYKTSEFFEKLNKCGNFYEIIMLRRILDGKLQNLINSSNNFDPANNSSLIGEIEFVSNYQAIQVGVRNTFGYVRSNSTNNSESGVGGGNLNINFVGGGGVSKQPPIARPTNSTNSSSSTSSTNSTNGGGSTCAFSITSGSSQSTSPFESNIISKRFSSANSLGPFSTTSSNANNGVTNSVIGGDLNGLSNGLNGLNGLNVNGLSAYEKWSNAGNEIFQNDPYSLTNGSSHADTMLDLSSKLMSTNIFPPKSQIKRQKMIYHCKFGEFGVMEGQFTEPSGVAVNAQNDIIVADTNNHRIQIFDKEGRFKFQFGECGKRDGQLLYPNRVAVVRTSGDIIVTERSPTHQIQIYNQYGQFVRKFGANILQHPRGVTVDNKGRIIVVECKVMRVIIFDQTGAVLQKFGCSKHLEFPNGVVVNDKQEIFISDNRAHCVKVFNYEGTYLRQIGGEGITNYPIGVGINAAGEILIADNHNNFNLTIFTQDGQLVSALESKVKHAQCFDVALMDDGSVVLASKDYRLYIYRYVQVPPIGL